MDLTSIIIPACDEEKYIDKTIKSYRAFEERGYCKELFVNQIWPYAKKTFLPGSTKKQLGDKHGKI